MKNDLQADFEKLGTVTEVYNTGKGFVFITFERKEYAESAIREMDVANVNGQEIRVNEAQPRDYSGGD